MSENYKYIIWNYQIDEINDQNNDLSMFKTSSLIERTVLR